MAQLSGYNVSLWSLDNESVPDLRLTGDHFVTVHYGPAIMANSAFHPSRVGKCVVIYMDYRRRPLESCLYFFLVSFFPSLTCGLCYMRALSVTKALMRRHVCRRINKLVYRAPATSPRSRGSCTSSQLSIISWHLNLPITRTLLLTLPLTPTLN